MMTLLLRDRASLSTDGHRQEHKPVFSFLRQALTVVPIHLPLRGPALFEHEVMRYKFQCNDTIERFTGVELNHFTVVTDPALRTQHEAIGRLRFSAYRRQPCMCEQTLRGVNGTASREWRESEICIGAQYQSVPSWRRILLSSLKNALSATCRSARWT
jgi:hypothetical protein